MIPIYLKDYAGNYNYISFMGTEGRWEFPDPKYTILKADIIHHFRVTMGYNPR